MIFDYFAQGKRPRQALRVAAIGVLVVYVLLLVISASTSQRSLRQSQSESFRLDLEKKAAALGYFFRSAKPTWPA